MRVGKRATIIIFLYAKRSLPITVSVHPPIPSSVHLSIHSTLDRWLPIFRIIVQLTSKNEEDILFYRRKIPLRFSLLYFLPWEFSLCFTLNSNYIKNLKTYKVRLGWDFNRLVLVGVETGVCKFLLIVEGNYNFKIIFRALYQIKRKSAPNLTIIPASIQ